MLRRLFNIQYPVLLSPMAGVSTPELAAEVSKAGGLGSLGLGSSSVEQAQQQIRLLRHQTGLPFQVNFFCHMPVRSDAYAEQQWVHYCCSRFDKMDLLSEFDRSFPSPYPSFLDNDVYADLVIQEKVPVVSFHFGIPHQQQIQKMKQAGIILMATATNLVEARIIANAGIDVVIAQGIEAGGHRGIFNPAIDAAIPTLDLVRLCKREVALPVVAAGGIMNGYHANIMKQAGADGVQLGTAFVQCQNSNASDAYRKALFNASITQISASISGRPARGLLNAWHKNIDTPDRPECPPYPYAYYFAKELVKRTKETRYSAFWAGSNVAQIQKIDAEALVANLAYAMGY